MSTEIYYFSGTGNSLAVARDIAEKLNGRLIPLSAVIGKDRISTDADVLGIVFPVYHAVHDGMPLIIPRLIGKIDNLDSKYLFAICTCKGWSRATIKKLGATIESHGGKLAAGFVVRMPDNSSPTTAEKQRRLFEAWKKKLGSVHRYVSARKKGKFERNVFFDLLMAPLAKKLKKTTLGLLTRLSHEPNAPFEELIPLTDRSYFTDEKCSGCGICAKVCPVGDIEMNKGRPVWLNRCEICLACLNGCPQEAIHGGLPSTDPHPIKYRHPDVKAAEMMKRGEV